MPEGLSIEQLKRPHSSIRRNPLIADLFFRAGYIEQFGSGIPRMTDALKKAGQPEPEFEEQGNGFVIQMFMKKAAKPGQQEIKDLNDRQMAAFEYVKEHGSIDNSTYQKLNTISRQTATRDLSDLTDKGVLEQKGKGAGTHYVLALRQ